MRRASLLLPLLALLTGCYGGRIEALEDELGQLRVELRAVRAEVRSVAATQAPVAPATPISLAQLDRLDSLEAKVAALEVQLRELSVGRSGPPPAPQPPSREPDLIELPGNQLPPKGGLPLEVLSVASGDLVLARVEGRLEKLSLAGLEAPLRPEQYDQDPSRRARIEVAFGEAAVTGEAAWSASREFLFERLKGTQLRLRYQGDRRRRLLDGSLPVVLELGEAPLQRDLNAELVAAGYALARDTTYRAQEEAARKERKGLFAPR